MTTKSIIQIDSKPVGSGVERSCYVHPHDRNLAIKIPTGKRTKQTEREVKYYRQLAKRGLTRFKNIPCFHGTAKTNLGEGMVVDLVRDYDGEISKSMQWYLLNGYSLPYFLEALEELKNFFLDNLIIFNYDMRSHNLLVQRYADGSFQLVMIDALGDIILIQLINRWKAQVRKKINSDGSDFTASCCVMLRPMKTSLNSQHERSKQEPSHLIDGLYA